jgi:serine/threonine protein phosphatase PrpC
VTQLFGKLFNRNKQEDQATVRIAKDETRPSPANHSDTPSRWYVANARSNGKHRDHNEDSSFVLATILANEEIVQPFGLYIIADGMGGHKHGEIASGIAVRAFSSYVVQHILLPLIDPEPASMIDSVQALMQNAVSEAHKDILTHAPGGGTTLTAAVVLDNQLTIAHIGDSRAYSISSQGEIEALTRDHSLVKRLVELGQITPEEAAVHPQRNVLYRALGQAEFSEGDILSADIPHNGYLLICSDGLWGVISEAEILDIIHSTQDLELACQRLIDAANDAGGPDNISAILVKVP